MGGSVRVGLEDNLYLSKGKLAKSNADLVAKMRRIVSLQLRSIAHFCHKIWTNSSSAFNQLPQESVG